MCELFIVQSWWATTPFPPKALPCIARLVTKQKGNIKKALFEHLSQIANFVDLP